ncbi:MAG: hypothetical protein HY298_20575 [Verrucomicrobia bacterium]|nr:hypothetical protein [Verrucomicrobiota bacterium]
MNFRKNLFFALLLVLGAASLRGHAATPTNSAVWAYTLVEGSYLVDDCPVCGRPTILLPMRGTFSLALVDQNPLFSTYEVRDISFKAGNSGWQYTVTGCGFYKIGGEVAVQQEMTLQVQIDNDYTNKLCYFTNGFQAIDRPWPMMNVTLTQTNGTFTQVFEMNLVAAPLREIWFSTASGFTAGKWSSPTNHISGGDLISSAGRIVKRNYDLTQYLGIMPVAPDVVLDAVDLAAGGEILFSINQDVFSETLGPLHHGDLLSNRGRIVKRNQQLMSSFGLSPSNADVGLDAVQMMDDGKILFSITTSVVSGTNGTKLYRGDILSDQGEIYRTHQQLLSRFHPAQTNQDCGLDALYVWPSGEIWFSTEDGFQDAYLGPILPGDLLSDQGYRVFGNLELISAFGPLEDAADFGLDALFVVTDVTPPAPAPRLLGIDQDPQTGNLTVQWEGKGRVFQLERAANVNGAYLPCSPIIPDSNFHDTAANQPQLFYRLREW